MASLLFISSVLFAQETPLQFVFKDKDGNYFVHASPWNLLDKRYADGELQFGFLFGDQDTLYHQDDVSKRQVGNRTVVTIKDPRSPTGEVMLTFDKKRKNFSLTCGGIERSRDFSRLSGKELEAFRERWKNRWREGGVRDVVPSEKQEGAASFSHLYQVPGTNEYILVHINRNGEIFDRYAEEAQVFRGQLPNLQPIEPRRTIIAGGHYIWINFEEGGELKRLSLPYHLGGGPEKDPAVIKKSDRTIEVTLIPKELEQFKIEVPQDIHTPCDVFFPPKPAKVEFIGPPPRNSGSGNGEGASSGTEAN